MGHILGALVTTHFLALAAFLGAAFAFFWSFLTCFFTFFLVTGDLAFNETLLRTLMAFLTPTFFTKTLVVALDDLVLLKDLVET